MSLYSSIPAKRILFPKTLFGNMTNNFLGTCSKIILDESFRVADALDGESFEHFVSRLTIYIILKRCL